MGTDIHTNIEVRNHTTGKYERKALYAKKDDGSYEEAWQLLDDRNYHLFGKLAGVRSYDFPFVSPRGLPDDPSDETLELYEKERDWIHNVTWYDYCELSLYAAGEHAYVDDVEYDEENKEYVTTDRYNVVEPYLNSIRMVLESYEVYYPRPGDARIVIWFDS